MIDFVSTRLEKKEVEQNLKKIFTLKIRKLLDLLIPISANFHNRN